MGLDYLIINEKFDAHLVPIIDAFTLKNTQHKVFKPYLITGGNDYCLIIVAENDISFGQ